MTDYTELIHRLRDTESRSKRKLLDEAAGALEELAKTSVVWHEVTTRPITDDEKSYYRDEFGLEIEAEETFDCVMPDDGQEILVATEWGVDKDICYSDYYGIGLEGRGDWDGVIAWAQMPTYRVKGNTHD